MRMNFDVSRKPQSVASPRQKGREETPGPQGPHHQECLPLFNSP
jgi:hypothetical protein